MTLEQLHALLIQIEAAKARLDCIDLVQGADGVWREPQPLPARRP